MKGYFSWSTSFQNGNTTLLFKSGKEKSSPKIFKSIEIVKILDQVYEEKFSREELDFLVEAIQAARIDIKNKKSNLKVVK